MKTALYIRCSTKTHNQDVENQLLQLTTYCQKAGLQIQKTYSDYESGDNADRKGFNEMLSDASKRKFELLLFWSLDRFSRSGTRDTIHYLQQLESYGVAYKSYTEPYLDSCGIFKDVVISILSTLARQEKVRLGERVRAGLEKAKSKGRIGGRPKLSAEIVKQITDLKAKGLSNRGIGRVLKVSNRTVGEYTRKKIVQN